MNFKILNHQISINRIQPDPDPVVELQREMNAQDQAYIELNNLYLSVEAGRTRLTPSIGNQLRCLVGQVYDLQDPGNQFIVDYWNREFAKLPGWLNV